MIVLHFSVCLLKSKGQTNKRDILFHFRDENEYIVRPLPHVKRNLSEPVLLYQVVQLLLTYDPAIVQRVASLLLHILEVCISLKLLGILSLFIFNFVIHLSTESLVRSVIGRLVL